jgi:hypothetical protein
VRILRVSEKTQEGPRASLILVRCNTGPACAGLTNGLSRMMGNYHIRFLGEGAAAMPLAYPTKWDEQPELIRSIAGELISTTWSKAFVQIASPLSCDKFC